jgi:hypothetical protein
MADFKEQKGDLNIQRFKKNGQYYGGFMVGVALTTQSISSTNSLRAFPFFVPKTMTFDRIAINVTTAASSGGVARLGIYADNGACYPGTLVLDAGEVATDSTGVKELTISTKLQGGKLYWLAVITGVATGTTVRAIDRAAAYPINGLDSALGTSPFLGYAVTQTYGTLPTTFPGSPTDWSLHVPLIALRKAS